jgi:pyrroloquinoline quinone (PQQ) biosynthesis protein C
MTTVSYEIASGEESLLRVIAPLRERLAEHPLYGAIRTVEALRVFQQSHVYAVWDFMSLLKALQRALTCVEVPWVPSADAGSRRLINEIVLGEESDEYQGEALSHFELYLRAMESCGADTSPVLRLIAELGAGKGPRTEPAARLNPGSDTGRGARLEAGLAGAPVEAAAFVRGTFRVLATGESHRIAAAFTYGREDLIPEMFTSFVRALDAEMPGQIAPFRYYLERHVELDGDHHAPMAAAMMRALCPTEKHWGEAAESAIEALEARLALWNGIYARLDG